jgi:hypothetical protein
MQCLATRNTFCYSILFVFLAIYHNMFLTLYAGWMYEKGEGCKKDLPKALQYYQKGAEQGSPPAQYNLGTSTHQLMRT